MNEEVCRSILETIGGTPLVKLGRIKGTIKSELMAKLECMNPGGSVKDRIGIAMIEAAESEGLLRPGGTIVEATHSWFHSRNINGCARASLYFYNDAADVDAFASAIRDIVSEREVS